MRRALCLFMIFLGIHSMCWSEEIKRPKLHVCAVASKPKVGLDQLLHSCEKQGIKIDILGMGKPYRGNIDKLLHTRNYLNTLPDEDVVLFVDAYDVLILADENTILDKFLDMDVPFVISVERNCWPNPNLASKYPKGPTSFCYINAGSYIGYVYNIKQILNELPTVKNNKSDQLLFTLNYFTHPEHYTLDYYCDLFLPLCKVEEEELIVDREKGGVQCRETGTWPCVVHGNGSSPIYQEIYNYLFLNKEVNWE
jgi:hypothetical protein